MGEPVDRVADVVIAPVALGFGALLVLPERGPLVRRDAVVVALLLLGAHVLRDRRHHDRGRRARRVAAARVARPLGIVAVPAAVYALWYVLEGASGQRNDTALSTALGDLPGVRVARPHRGVQ